MAIILDLEPRIFVPSEFRKFFLVPVRSIFVGINKKSLNSKIIKETMMRIASLDEKDFIIIIGPPEVTSEKCQERYFYSRYGFKSVLLD